MSYFEVTEVDGQSIGTADEFYAYVRSRPEGSLISYSLRRGDEEIARSISTRRFSYADYFWFFGLYLVVGLAFSGVALSVLFLGGGDPVAKGSAAFLGLVGMWSLTAIDLYGPHYFFRVHAALEAFVIAGVLHMALVFPSETTIKRKLPGLVPSLYLAVGALVLVVQVTLFDASKYVAIHQVVISLMAVSFLALVFAMARAYFRPTNFEAQQRAKVVAIAMAGSAGASMLLLAASISGEPGTEKLLVVGLFMPLSIGYAVIKEDLLEADEILRRSLFYAVLTTIVAILYAGVVASLESLSRGHNIAAGWLSALFFAAVSIFVILPLRDRVQSTVDRFFFRSVYDFRIVVEEVSRGLARVSEVDVIVEDVRSAVLRSLSPEFARLTVVDNKNDERAAELAMAGIVDDRDGGLTIPFVVAKKAVAIMVIGRQRSGRFYSGGDRTLLQTLANQAAVAIENALAIDKVKDLNRTLEARVAERTAELGEALERLKDAQVHLVQSERLAAIGELSAGVAHEVNNPLNFARNSLATLKSYVADVTDVAAALAKVEAGDTEALLRQVEGIRQKMEVLHFESIEEDLNELVTILIDALDRTAQLVADLRDYAAPGKGGESQVDISAGINSTLQLMGHEIRLSSISILNEVPDGLPPVKGDASALNQVFLNLVKNALEALEGDDKTIWIRAQHKGAHLEVEVADNGSGFGEADSERLFEPFFTTKGAGRGTGLGLAMCRRIVEEHGGSISLANRIGGGTQVRLQLPVAASDSA